MPFIYSFTSPNEAQLQRRRHLLDFYGQFAQLSALALLLLVQIPLLVRAVKSRFRSTLSSNPRKEHPSPVVSRFGKRFVNTEKTDIPRWRRLEWLLDGQIAQGWGTWRLLLTATLWTIWLFILATGHTGHDYLHLTKRFGIIGASQLPLHYLLALKSWSPVCYLTRLSHEELNPYHRALGRILLLFFSLHASFYLNFYVQKGLLLKRIQDQDVILGLLAIASFLILGITALARIREKKYFLFFTIHVLTSICVLPILYFHVSHIRPYILESALIYLLLILQRNISQTRAPNAIITELSVTSNLVSIAIPLTPALRKKSFHPGQHIYLSLPSTSLTAPQEKLRLNPFTIANLPTKDNHIRLVFRALRGTTRILLNVVRESSSGEVTTPLLIEGPYGAAAHFPNLLNFDKVLFVAGGVGATFTVPIYRDLMDRGFEATRARFVWSVPRLEDTQWAREYLGDGCSIHVTRSSRKANRLSPQPPKMQEQWSAGVDEEVLEMQEWSRLVADVDGSASVAAAIDDVSSSAAEYHQPGVSLLHGRPDLSSIVSQVFGPDPDSGQAASAKVAILVCGPAGMGAALRREVGRSVEEGKVEVWWHNEEFGW
ncbi:MAG: hypothetical protein Q9179_006252 [Wetmoreana sp. 5 TL-2023]